MRLPKYYNDIKQSIKNAGYKLVTNCSMGEDVAGYKVLCDGNDFVIDFHKSAYFIDKDNSYLIRVYYTEDAPNTLYLPELSNSVWARRCNIVKTLNENYCYSFDYGVTKGISLKQFGTRKFDKSWISLMYSKKEYPSVSTGINRYVRNVVVMDIDTDTNKYSDEFDELLGRFDSKHISPTFICKNNLNGHVQLQWLLDNFVQYKLVPDDKGDFYVEKNRYLLKTTSQNCVDLSLSDRYNYVMTDLCKSGEQYKTLTCALNKLCKGLKHMYQDSNFTGWRCKNPFAVETVTNEWNQTTFYFNKLINKYIEIDGSEIAKLGDEKYREVIFKKYDFNTLYNMFDCNIEITKGAVRKKIITKQKKTNCTCTDRNVYVPTVSLGEDVAESRNDFTFMLSLKTAGALLRSGKFALHERLPLISETYNIVSHAYNEKDKEYNGVWPGTKNGGAFTDNELKRNVESATNYVISTFNHSHARPKKKISEEHSEGGYTDEQRKYAALEKSKNFIIKQAFIKFTKETRLLTKRKDIVSFINNYLLGDIKESYLSSKKVKEAQQLSNKQFWKTLKSIKDNYISTSTSNFRKTNWFRVDGFTFDEKGKKHRAHIDYPSEVQQMFHEFEKWVERNISKFEKRNITANSTEIHDNNNYDIIYRFDDINNLIKHWKPDIIAQQSSFY